MEGASRALHRLGERDLRYVLAQTAYTVTVAPEKRSVLCASTYQPSFADGGWLFRMRTLSLSIQKPPPSGCLPDEQAAFPATR